jgi:hypothetical protein
MLNYNAYRLKYQAWKSCTLCMGHGVCGSDRLVVEFKSSYTISLSHYQQINLKSVPTIVKVTVVSSIPGHGEVYSIQKGGNQNP